MSTIKTKINGAWERVAGNGSLSEDCISVDLDSAVFGQAPIANATTLNGKPESELSVYNSVLLGGKPESELNVASAENANKLDNYTYDEIMSKVYPVGSVYISVTETAPNVLFGFGTWERIKDRFLLAAGSSYAAGATGGEASHTLTVDEMPSHTHIVSNYESMVGLSGSSPSYSYLNNTDDGYTGNTNPTSKATGGSKPHNNMPPYLAVYIWKRTA